MESFKDVIQNNSKLVSDKKLKLPHGTESLSYQIAGHRFNNIKYKFGLLKHSESGDILKPIFDKRSERERHFYETVFSSKNDQDLCIRSIRELVPLFKGIFHDSQMNIDYIRLADITANLSQASILDIKIGPITYDPEATEEKRQTEIKKYPHAKTLGFRILGMRFFDRITDKCVFKDKDFGLSISPNDVSNALQLFCQNDTTLLNVFKKKIHNVANWFYNMNISKWKFLSSSLLLVYGNQKVDINNFDDKSGKCTIAEIKMIDFAHVFPNDKKLDENYISGLTSLIQYFELAIASTEEH